MISPLNHWQNWVMIISFSVIILVTLGACSQRPPPCDADCWERARGDLNEATRCQPKKENVARYREVQAVQDELSTALRGVFAKHRALTVS